jgi:ATP-dependent Clp protease adaptor protein ClpS
MTEHSDAKGVQPALYRVMLLNDDKTPMEFVVHVLERFFELDRHSAMRLMLRVHNEGIGECGSYPHAEADKRVAEVLAFAREHQHPLQCVLELVPTSQA